MEFTKETSLILGRPFLSTAGAQIDVGAGEIRFNINGKEEKFDFWPRQEQCSMIKIKYGPNPQGIKEVEIQPQLVDKATKRGRSRKRTIQSKKKKLRRLFPHHLKRIKRCGNKKKKLQNLPPHHPNPTKWCGDPKRYCLLLQA